MTTSLSVTILGSGTCVPSLRRSSCSFLIKTGRSLLLFDCGAGTMRRLLEAGHILTDVTHLFISHTHLDHVGEFASFLFSTKYGGFFSKRTPFTVIAARGFASFMTKNDAIYGRWIDMEGMLSIVECDNEDRNHRSFSDFDCISFPMNHIDSSVGFRITTAEGISVAYTGDTDYCDAAVALAADCDILVCECAFPDDMKREGHLTPSLAGTIAVRSRARHLVLTHFYPECETVDIAAECRKTYQGKLTLAEDMMEIIP